MTVSRNETGEGEEPLTEERASHDTAASPLSVRGVAKTFGGGFDPMRVLPWNRGKKQEGPRRVVDNVSLEVKRGEIFGVIGANGSGKSTLIRIVSTLLLPDEGEVSVFGIDVVKDAMEVRALC